MHAANRCFPGWARPRSSGSARFHQPQRFAAGERLFATDEPSPGMFVPILGRAAISRRDGLGHIVQVVEQGAGEFLGEVAQLSGRPPLADADATPDVDRSRWVILSRTRPTWGTKVSRKELEPVEQMVAAAIHDGAKVATGGAPSKTPPLPGGCRYAPTVLTDVGPDMAIVNDEIFGPVAPVLPLDRFDDAVRIPNASRFGLSAYLFTRDIRPRPSGPESGGRRRRAERRGFPCAGPAWPRRMAASEQRGGVRRSANRGVPSPRKRPASGRGKRLHPPPTGLPRASRLRPLPFRETMVAQGARHRGPSMGMDAADAVDLVSGSAADTAEQANLDDRFSVADGNSPATHA